MDKGALLLAVLVYQTDFTCTNIPVNRSALLGVFGLRFFWLVNA